MLRIAAASFPMVARNIAVNRLMSRKDRHSARLEQLTGLRRVRRPGICSQVKKACHCLWFRARTHSVAFSGFTHSNSGN
jgi:hypothetical protein